MSEMMTMMARRRSVPPAGMKGPGPDRGQLEQLLTLAARVPDHGKLAPFRFVVIAGAARERLAEAVAAAARADLPGATAAAIAAERARFTQAPVIVAVVSTARPHPKIPLWEQQLCAGAACMALTLAANAMGFVTSWLTGWPAFDRRVLNVLGLAPHERIAGYVHIGQATATPPERERPDMTQIVTWFGEE
ncbi:nitroreductase [Camelimonas abortus]|uniref:Putative NAD(P)H nitroreductase n=1 Tax=Camelimonas abortus TaxID=1017184 RepID=A0ABV7LGH4_9HYPH